MTDLSGVLPGTLELLIRPAVSLGKLHGVAATSITVAATPQEAR